MLNVALPVTYSGVIAVQVLFQRGWFVALWYEFLPGCWGSTNSPVDTYFRVWAILLSFEGVLLLLTAYKVFSSRNTMGLTISLIARDSIVYFLVVFACATAMLAYDLHPQASVISIEIPALCTTSIMMTRMMMNIRGLVLADPAHTSHLKTLEFFTPNRMQIDTDDTVAGDSVDQPGGESRV